MHPTKKMHSRGLVDNIPSTLKKSNVEGKNPLNND